MYYSLTKSSFENGEAKAYAGNKSDIKNWAAPWEIESRLDVGDVLVFVTMDRCGACKQIQPMIAQLSRIVTVAIIKSNDPIMKDLTGANNHYGMVVDRYPTILKMSNGRFTEKYTGKRIMKDVYNWFTKDVISVRGELYDST